MFRNAEGKDVFNKMCGGVSDAFLLHFRWLLLFEMTRRHQALWNSLSLINCKHNMLARSLFPLLYLIKSLSGPKKEQKLMKPCGKATVVDDEVVPVSVIIAIL